MAPDLDREKPALEELRDPDWRYGWFDGVFRGIVGEDPLDLEILSAEIRHLGLGDFLLSYEGNRFTFLADDRILKPRVCKPERIELLRRILARLPESRGSAAGFESTLRCTMVGESETDEFLYVPDRGTVHVIRRRRPVDAGDLARDPERRRLPSWNRRQVLRAGSIAFLIVAASVGLAWKRGYFETLFGTGPGDLELDAGPFAGDLEITVERAGSRNEFIGEWKKGFGASEKGFDEYLTGVSDPERKRAYRKLVSEGRFWLVLEDERGKALETRRIFCTPPWESREAFRALMHPRIGAVRFRLLAREPRRKGE